MLRITSTSSTLLPSSAPDPRLQMTRATWSNAIGVGDAPFTAQVPLTAHGRARADRCLPVGVHRIQIVGAPRRMIASMALIEGNERQAPESVGGTKTEPRL